jgi:hypothetical protein
MSRVSRGSAARQGGPLGRSWRHARSEFFIKSPRIYKKKYINRKKGSKRNFARARIFSSAWISLSLRGKKSVSIHQVPARVFYLGARSPHKHTHTGLAARARHSQEEVLHLLNWSLWTSVLCDKNNNKMRKYVRCCEQRGLLHFSWDSQRSKLK